MDYTLQSRIRFDSSGNVGIGTTKPTSKLDVRGSISGTSLSGILNWVDVSGAPPYELPPGSILVYDASMNIDDSFILADGRTVNRADYPELADVLGIPFNQATFQLPNPALQNQADWDVSNNLIQTYIKNKPNIYKDVSDNVRCGTHLIPSSNVTYDLGSSSYRWRDLYLSGNTIDLGGTKITKDVSSGGIKIQDNVGNPLNGTFANILPSNNLTYNLGSPDNRWNDLYLSGNSIDLSGTILSRHTDGSLMVHDASGSMITGRFNDVTTVGNVGVGTDNPSYKLHVIGDTRIQGNLTVNGTQTIIDTDVQVTDMIEVINDGTGPALRVTQTGVEPIADFCDDTSNNIVFRIADGGNVGIGTLNPQAKLDVSGNIFVSGNIYKNGELLNNSVGDSIPIGTISPYYSSTLTDSSWLICDGATYQRSQYIELANALGVNPSATTFTVPDLRDKFLKGKNTDVVGDTGGSATTTLTVANLPDHTHTGTTDNMSANAIHRHQIPMGDKDDLNCTHATAQNALADGPGVYWTGSYTDYTNVDHTHSFTTSGTTGATATPFTNQPPYTTIIYIIKAKNNQYVTPIRDGDYWTDTSNNLFYQSGNVGIGTNRALSLLDVNGNSYFRGNVGIGTNIPQAKLDVSGNVQLNNSNLNIIGDNQYNIYTADASYSTSSQLSISTKSKVGAYNEACLRIGTTTDQALGTGFIQTVNPFINTSLSLNLQPKGGNVGIGTNNPQYKLHVEGNINTIGALYMNNNILLRNYIGYSSVVSGNTYTTPNASVWYDTFSISYTRKHSNSVIEIKLMAALSFAIGASGTTSYGSMYVRLKITYPNSGVEYSGTNKAWQRIDNSLFELNHIRHLTHSLQNLNLLPQNSSVTIMVQVYREVSSGTFGYGGLNSWGEQSKLEVFEYF